MTSKRDSSVLSLKDGCVETKAKVILLDIEGTTTSISFVKDELFPYILDNVEQYLTKHWNDDETKADVEALRQQAENDAKLEVEGVVSILPNEDNTDSSIIKSIVENVKWQMGKDRKVTALKQLQGHMWQDAYKNKEVRGHLFDDVERCLKKWKEEEKIICIYSSGSVHAQKLLFTYSINGDMTESLSDYFDTKIGGKREATSYIKICDQLNTKPVEVLFLTDIIEAARAAGEAGVDAVIMLRPGNAPLTEEQLSEFKTMTSFNQLIFHQEDDETPTKKQNDSNETQA